MNLYDETDCLPHVKPDGGPAFPVETTSTPWAPGLTKREYAAIHIAAAIAGRRVNITPAYDASDAVALADAVLREAGE